ncbi:uncharacterized protein IL334_005906 [Kwoniella shivajii]|uniref:Major facilitator superfamily (MFS) profile domain-containing protein n=1 Tax=Kwoniella shivajii TaxID=564305 RepID=A0ABZ1D5Z2_9TREE|nr:hypothetical protein IL334_005906 [Kwoniella shivajii]
MELNVVKSLLCWSTPVFSGLPVLRRFSSVLQTSKCCLPAKSLPEFHGENFNPSPSLMPQKYAPWLSEGFLTTYANFCWGWGQLVGIGVIKSQVGRTDQWAYRIPYGLMNQWIFYPPLIISINFAPESPWWLVRRGRIEQAKRSLTRLTSAKSDPTFDVDETVEMIRHTTKLENDITSGASYLDCLKGVDLRRIEIVRMLWATQNLAGNTFSIYSTYFFEQAGLSGEIPYDFAMGQYAINMVGVFGTWFLMTYIGHRKLFTWSRRLRGHSPRDRLCWPRSRITETWRQSCHRCFDASMGCHLSMHCWNHRICLSR